MSNNVNRVTATLDTKRIQAFEHGSVKPKWCNTYSLRPPAPVLTAKAHSLTLPMAAPVRKVRMSIFEDEQDSDTDFKNQKEGMHYKQPWLGGQAREAVMDIVRGMTSQVMVEQSPN